MKIRIFILFLFSPMAVLYAQLYSPEIKVQPTTGNQVEVGTDQTTSNLKVYGDINSNRLSSTGLSIGAASGSEKLYIYGGNSVSDLKLWASSNGWSRLVVGTLNAGDIGFITNNSGTTRYGIPNNKLGIYTSWSDFFIATSANSTQHSVKFRIDTGGRVGIGYPSTITFTHLLQVAGTVSSNGQILTSDRKLKKDIKDNDQGIDLVKQMHTVKFKYKPRKIITNEMDTLNGTNKTIETFEADDTEHIGVIAQEIQQIAPNLVGSYIDDEDEEVLTINFSSLTFILVNAVKQQQAQIEQQQTMIESLQQSIKKLEQKK